MPLQTGLKINKDINISFTYEKIYVSGVDYTPLCHIEVMGEAVESDYDSSFVINAKNNSITKVFRIVNQTTGEIYNPLFSLDNKKALPETPFRYLTIQE